MLDFQSSAFCYVSVMAKICKTSHDENIFVKINSAHFYEKIIFNF
jgi:hypothetical protein